MDRKYLVGGVLLIVLTIVVGVVLSRPGTDGKDGRDGRDGLGAFPGPKITSTFLSFNGIEKQYQSSPFNQATTTICSLATPKATSSLAFYSIITTQGSTTVLMLEVVDAKAPGAVATTAATVLTTLPFNVAANTRQSSGTTTVGWKFAPSRFLNFLYTVKAVEGTTNTLKGKCNAEFIVY